MNPSYPVYIISKGRYESRLTSKALDEMKVLYKIVVEPQEYNNYAANIDKDKILVLPFSNLGQGSIPARNWVMEHSISDGYNRHWILDDNIRYFRRYNNDKKSFEYFSNNSIPYRYLEPLARKYVMTYWCKPIFVSMEDELKRSEEKYDEDKKKQLLQESNKPTNPRLAQLKNYNKTVKDTAIKPMKNRTNANLILPPQIKSNLPDVNKASEKQLLKEKANRYTWEGRLSDFCPLKKIDRKITDKKLAMTYADFKKMQLK